MRDEYVNAEVDIIDLSGDDVNTTSNPTCEEYECINDYLNQ